MIPKFRLWNKKNEEMITDPQRVGDLMGQIIVAKMSGKEEKDYVVMVGSGLKDKNKEEIFEGDVVKTPYGDGFIEWIWGSFRMALRHGTSFELGDFIFKHRIEVIDNIYEDDRFIKWREK